MTKKKCEKCGRKIGIKGFTNHMKACGGKEKKAAKCLHCGKIFKTQNSIYMHGKVHGLVSVQKGKDWKYVETKKANGEVKQKTKIITPEARFIDVPVVLRIPLTLGVAQIVALEN
ncbi:hypothetical protein AC477_02860 [miscellaneous Crenarchaeota group-1 archaeon SG8-32-1]|uniref:C2H2-type domain-containing protein n=1 Tax=miscellaneous Crenarchaeota group-1 archaeon SG8-32-1 TaxID=1685124 RepID=A0A0M0BWJ9_9ARCH|nr:MAG: hypothetical protein AC477_02860 [miscellaneous Crenarchaeota group-1 archaeon SG8-32-1]